MPEPIALDARLLAIADLVMQAIAGREAPHFADVGCDHGYLTAYLLESCPRLTALACDVSAPSLDKARRLMTRRALNDRVRFAVADGLAAIDVPVDAIVLAGMGAETILSIVRAGRARIGQAALIVQANTDLPLLRAELAAMGFAAEREVFVQAAGRRYVTMCMRAAQPRELSAREALLGAASQGAQDAEQRAYFTWQRDVRVREMQQAVQAVLAKDSILGYITDLCIASRESGLLQVGLSPRAALHLDRLAKARAFVVGRDYVIPEDVQAVFEDVANHRVLLSQKARMNGVTVRQALAQLLDAVPAPDWK